MDKNEVKSIAKLARLKFDDSELDAVAKDMEGILKWIDILKTADVSKVDNINDDNIALRMRDDIVKIGNLSGELMKNATEPYDNFFTVPKVVE